MNKPLHIYIASAFFNDPIYTWTDMIANRIEETFGDKVTLYVPQRNDDINNKEDGEGGTDIDIYVADIQNQLMKADLLIASLDNDDAGVNAEVLGAAMYNELKDKTIPIIGLTTDMRYGAEGDDHFYINKLVVGAIKQWGWFIEGKPHDREAYIREILYRINMVLERR